MSIVIEPGRIVALTQCPAFNNDGENVSVSGLFELIEFDPADPSAGIPSASWLVVAEGTPPDAPDDKWLSIDPYVMMEQTDPDAYASMLVQERQMDWYSESY